MKSPFKKTGVRHEITHPRPKMKGLGDAVAMIAQPIARTIDAAFGTDVQNCGGCKARREALNEKISFHSQENNN